MPAEMPHATALFLTGLVYSGETDRQTDRLFGYWLMATRNGNAFAEIKNVNTGVSPQQA